LLATLFVGEKKRAVASTGMNDRSLRSHTIFRITVESRKKSLKMDDDDGVISSTVLLIRHLPKMMAPYAF